MPKKNLIEEALIEAEELERASIENAKEIVLESFKPDFVNFFKDVLNEAEENFKDDEDVPDDEELDDEELEEGDKPTFKKGVKPDFGKKGDDDEDDEELEEDAGGRKAAKAFKKIPKKQIKPLKKEGNEHDVGKEPDAGRQGTDPAVDDEEESLNQDDKDDPMKEGKYDDVSGDATPEKGQAGLPAPKPKVKKVGKGGWEDEGASDVATDDPEGPMNALPGKKPPVKQTGDGGWEDEGAAPIKREGDPEKGNKSLPGAPSAKVVREAEKDKDDDKELDVPDELFDDEDDKDDTDVNIDIEIEDDDDKDDKKKDSVDEAADVEDDDYDGDMPDDEDDEDDEVNENLYVYRGGKFTKITPGRYLKTRVEKLSEENSKLRRAIGAQKEQLIETHLFNAKLAHLNKAFMTGAFTNSEKEQIAEKLDECETITEVKDCYKTIISEVTDANPLDRFSNLIKEQRTSREAKTENIYESADVKRMKRLINYKTE